MLLGPLTSPVTEWVLYWPQFLHSKLRYPNPHQTYTHSLYGFSDFPTQGAFASSTPDGSTDSFRTCNNPLITHCNSLSTTQRPRQTSNIIPQNTKKIEFINQICNVFSLEVGSFSSYLKCIYRFQILSKVRNILSHKHTIYTRTKIIPKGHSRSQKTTGQDKFYSYSLTDT